MTDDLVSWSSVLSQVSLGTPPLISLLTISDKKHRSGSDWQRQSSIVGAWNNLFENVVISLSQGCRISLCGKRDDPLQTSCARQKVWHIAPLIYLLPPCLHLMFYLDAHFALYLTIIAATNARESISLKRHQLVQKQNGQQKQKTTTAAGYSTKVRTAFSRRRRRMKRRRRKKLHVQGKKQNMGTELLQTSSHNNQTVVSPTDRSTDRPDRTTNGWLAGWLDQPTDRTNEQTNERTTRTNDPKQSD